MTPHPDDFSRRVTDAINALSASQRSEAILALLGEMLNHMTEANVRAMKAEVVTQFGGDGTDALTIIRDALEIIDGQLALTTAPMKFTVRITESRTWSFPVEAWGAHPSCGQQGCATPEHSLDRLHTDSC